MPYGFSTHYLKTDYYSKLNTWKIIVSFTLCLSTGSIRRRDPLRKLPPGLFVTAPISQTFVVPLCTFSALSFWDGHPTRLSVRKHERTTWPSPGTAWQHAWRATTSLPLDLAWQFFSSTLDVNHFYAGFWAPALYSAFLLYLQVTCRNTHGLTLMTKFWAGKLFFFLHTGVSTRVVFPKKKLL